MEYYQIIPFYANLTYIDKRAALKRLRAALFYCPSLRFDWYYVRHRYYVSHSTLLFIEYYVIRRYYVSHNT